MFLGVKDGKAAIFVGVKNPKGPLGRASKRDSLC
jgi:hypothetical protein